MAHAGKGLLKTIGRRLSYNCEAEGILPEEQCGFRLGRSTIDSMIVVCRLQGVGQRQKTPQKCDFRSHESVRLCRRHPPVDCRLAFRLSSYYALQIHAVIRECMGMDDDVCLERFRVALNKVSVKGVEPLHQYFSTSSSWRCCMSPWRFPALTTALSREWRRYGAAVAGAGAKECSEA